jgi:ankyrin repeat protein
MKSIIELIYNGDFNAAKQRIESTDLTLVDKEGDTALHIGVIKNNEEIVKLLLQSNCNVNAQNKKGKVPLHYAAELNLIEIAKLLIEMNADLGISDNYGNQPLWTAIFSAADGQTNKLPIVELFLQNGADKNHKNDAGRSPMDFANQVKHEPLLEILNKH